MRLFDPDRAAIDALLAPHLAELEADDFDVEESIYWFCHNNHSGQASNLYSVMCSSDYHPSPIKSDITEEDGAAFYLYNILTDEKEAYEEHAQG